MRLLIDDPTKQDPRALLQTAKLAALFDITPNTPQYITCTGDAEITVAEGSVVSVGGAVFKTGAIVINAASLDSGAEFSVGRDYYVYICDPGSGGDDIFKISLNSTYPAGYTAATSRKIGGFHFGVVRRISANNIPVDTTGAELGAGWEANVYNGIVPRSVWTLKHRPKCQPEGMIYLSGGLWVDIYISSDDGAGGLKSTYGSTPMTGTEGMSQYTFNERSLKAGKRLLNYDEWCKAAFGSPEGLDGDNTNAWSAGTARNPTGGVLRAVSSVGARDCVGNVWEWLRDIFHEPVAAPAGAWQDPMPDAGVGQLWMYSATGIHTLIAGGDWNDGSHDGSRALYSDGYPWSVNSAVGVRLACDSL